MRAPAIGLIAVLALLAAGCGGSKAPSVASLTTTSSATTSTTSPRIARPSPAALAACFDAHGLSASVGSASTAPDDAVDVAGVVVTGEQPSSPLFQAAMQACRSYLPGGGPPTSTPAQRAGWAKAMRSFAACMRRSGVPSFPDPTGQGTFPPGSLQGIDPSSPLVQKAFQACESLEPKRGPFLQL